MSRASNLGHCPHVIAPLSRIRMHNWLPDRTLMLCVWGFIFAIAAIPIADFVRRCITDESVLISSLPFLIFFLVWTCFLQGAIPSALLYSLVAILVLCAIGTITALLNRVPAEPIRTAIVGKLSWFVSAFVAYYVAKVKRAEVTLGIAISSVVLLSFVFTIFHIAMGYPLVGLGPTPGTYLERVYESYGTVNYYYGIFRNPEIYASFLCFFSVPLLIIWLSKERGRYPIVARTVMLLAILSLLPQAALSGRRSQMCILFLTLISPFVKPPRHQRDAVYAIVFILALVGLITFLNVTPMLHGNARLQHLTNALGEDLLLRLHETKSADIDIGSLHFWGQGAGTVGYAALASSNDGHFARFYYGAYLKNYAMHYGWYQSLYAYGFPGFIAQLICFGNIFLCFMRSLDKGRQEPKIGITCFSASVFIFFFIQTSFLDSITISVMFGIAVGYALSSCDKPTPARVHDKNDRNVCQPRRRILGRRKPF